MMVCGFFFKQLTEVSKKSWNWSLKSLNEKHKTKDSSSFKKWSQCNKLCRHLIFFIFF